MTQQSADTKVDVIVIGSGFGGAVTACRLVQAGFRVCLLERGRRLGPDEFRGVDDVTSLLPDLTHGFWVRDQGLWDLKGVGDCDVGQAAGFGGGSLIYANVHLRAHPSTFETGFPSGYSRAALDPYYDLVAHMLELATPTQLGLSDTPKSRAFKRAASSLGRAGELFETPIAVRASERFSANLHGREQGGCDGCGACDVGCGRAAKNSLDYNYLHLLEEARSENGDLLADVRTLCEVTGIEAPRCEAGEYTVRYVNHLRMGRAEHIKAKRVFLCAGALNSTELLLRSRKTLPRLSNALGSRVYTNGDLLGVVVGTREPHTPTHGPTITTGLVHREADGCRIVLQEGGFPLSLRGCLAAFEGRALLSVNRHRDVPVREDEARTRNPSATVEDPSLAAAWDVVRELIDERYGFLYASQIGDSVRVGKERLLSLAREEVAALVRATELRLLDARVEALEANITSALARLGIVVRPDSKSWTLVRTAVSATLQRTLRTIASATRVSLGVSDDRLLRASWEAIQARLGAADPMASIERAVRFALTLDRDREQEQTAVDHTAVLLAMVADMAPSHARLDRQGGITLEVPNDSKRGFETAERLMRDFAKEYGGELRMPPGWATARRPLTVHLHGGCAMSDSPAHGVTDAHGEVHGHPGLYVSDGALLPQAIGTNPSSTIAAIAERNIEHHIRRWLGDSEWKAPEWQAARSAFHERQLEVDPPATRLDYQTQPIQSSSVGVKFSERMTGFLSEAPPGVPDAAEYERAEQRGHRSGEQICLILECHAAELGSFLDDPMHELQVRGHVELTRQRGLPGRSYPTHGALRFFVPGDHLGERLITYELAFETEAGPATLSGRKILYPDTRLDVWRDAVTVYCDLELADAGRRSGVVRISAEDYLRQMLPSLEVTGTQDPARIAWSMARFVGFLSRGFMNVYARARRGNHLPVPRLTRVFGAGEEAVA